ncbi:MAG: hypothetical protein RLP02_16870 [Coleofasciculus sp. C2-GNP5-27]
MNPVRSRLTHLSEKGDDVQIIPAIAFISSSWVLIDLTPTTE